MLSGKVANPKSRRFLSKQPDKNLGLIKIKINLNKNYS
jgi:hypothetical protein